MDQKEWDALAVAIQRCKNVKGTLAYEHDVLSSIIDSFAEANLNHYRRPETDNYWIKPEEVDGAIVNWVHDFRRLEEDVWATHAKIALGDEKYSKIAQEALYDSLVKERKLLCRGHVAIQSINIPLCQEDAHPEDFVKELYELIILAVEEFEKSPTAFITFPFHQINPLAFVGLSKENWSHRYNRKTLRTELRQRLPHFLVKVVRTDEGVWGTEKYTHPGVLFLYRSPLDP